ncbi:hypothetical protein [Capnocytophaga sp. oral taxon 878]|uniref:hypothetical protein n=1 Tax=Capnocytophaga sp. oral taxon 878 TaxID=1316596 RepID=UPI000D033785|nr:hypothetical protein [Capnocytophaga sp. oral taxon 878]AVM49320.1 hypothetical protein C4H12_01875 [Capnocytophaga sp. oral taxon 878]
MFDTLYLTRLTAALASPCQGLGGCDNHRARAARAEEHFNALPGQIDSVKAQITEIEHGQQQHEFNLLKQKQDSLSQKNTALDQQITQAKLLADAWEMNPATQANLEGLGWFGKRLWNKAFSCETYEEREKNFTAQALPLEQELSKVQAQLNERRQRLSPENIQIQRNAVFKLEKEKEQKEALLASHNQRITAARNSYIANRDAERLATEQQARDAEAKQAAENTVKDKTKQTQTLILLSAAVIGGYILLKPSAKKVTV